MATPRRKVTHAVAGTGAVAANRACPVGVEAKKTGAPTCGALTAADEFSDKGADENSWWASTDLSGEGERREAKAMRGGGGRAGLVRLWVSQ
jgi:hypothetical protein